MNLHLNYYVEFIANARSTQPESLYYPKLDKRITHPRRGGSEFYIIHIFYTNEYIEDNRNSEIPMLFKYTHTHTLTKSLYKREENFNSNITRPHPNKYLTFETTLIHIKMMSHLHKCKLPCYLEKLHNIIPTYGKHDIALQYTYKCIYLFDLHLFPYK